MGRLVLVELSITAVELVQGFAKILVRSVDMIWFGTIVPNMSGLRLKSGLVQLTSWWLPRFLFMLLRVLFLQVSG